ncbi:MAG: hypothetical protein COV43_05830 [Deltaproteobacteria bacterium CG11_big_fil_rev_8_21_14_0_20_42_23]|nr:MAG: hypothetical protein COV43_05830 [Deltaproteobacteria bacterium CG11_big_fil_rev_8_21_14_0_20_42_23]PJC63685.1 MAG: hypothetical protein CO021_08350 [Deltaproteobacteria bacterium CG_4_9_14_0_2_um_filter_42_21]
MGIGGIPTAPAAHHPLVLPRPLGPTMMYALHLAKAKTPLAIETSFRSLCALLGRSNRFHFPPHLSSFQARDIQEVQTELLDGVASAVEGALESRVFQDPREHGEASSMIVRAGAELMLTIPAVLKRQNREVPFDGEVIPLVDLVTYDLLSVETALRFVSGLQSELPVYLRELHRRIDLEGYGSFDLNRFRGSVPRPGKVKAWLAENPVEKGMKLYHGDYQADRLKTARPARHAFAFSALTFLSFAFGYTQTDFMQALQLQFSMSLAAYAGVSWLDAKRWRENAKTSTDLSAMLYVLPQVQTLWGKLSDIHRVLTDMKEAADLEAALEAGTVSVAIH